MALNCQLSINPPSYAAGNTPPPALSLLVANPNAVAVAVTGFELQFFDQNGVPQQPPASRPLFPFGPGQGTSIAANSNQTFGPMSISAGNVGNMNPTQMVPPGSQPVRTQGSVAPQYEMYVGALVYGSDGSINSAGRARLLVSYSPQAPRGTQGGNSDFTQASNSALEAVVF